MRLHKSFIVVGLLSSSVIGAQVEADAQDVLRRHFHLGGTKAGVAPDVTSVPSDFVESSKPKLYAFGGGGGVGGVGGVGGGGGGGGVGGVGGAGGAGGAGAGTGGGRVSSGYPPKYIPKIGTGGNGGLPGGAGGLPGAAPGPNPMAPYLQTINEPQVNAQLTALKIPVAPPLIVPPDSPEACALAEKTLRNASSDADGSAFMSTWMRKILSPKAIGGRAIDEEAAIRNSLKSYSEACLRDWPTVAKSVGANVGESAFGALVLVSGDQAAPWCSGTRIAANYVVTARHCFLEEDTQSVSTNVRKEIAAGNVSFVLPFSGYKRLNVIALRCVTKADLVTETCRRFVSDSTTVSVFSSDFALLELESNDFPVSSIAMDSSALKAGASVVLAGWNTIAAMDAAIDALQAGRTPTLEDRLQMRVSRTGSCTVASVSNDCIVHTCQATPGSSGAGLFQIEANGTLRLVGIHVASTTVKDDYLYGATCNFALLPVPENLYKSQTVRFAGNLGLRVFANGSK